MDSSRTAESTEGAGEEPSGPTQYLGPGETLFKVAENIGIKKFYFTAYLTNKRLFFIDRDEKRPGVTAKEIPLGAIADCILETPESADPMLSVSVKTSDDEIRIMKLIFYEGGEDRTPEMAEWIRLIRQGPKKMEERSLPPTGPAVTPAGKSSASDTPSSPGTRAPLQGAGISPSARRQTAIPVQQEQPHELPMFADEEPVAAAREQRRQGAKPSKVIEREIEEPTGGPLVMFCHHCGKKIPPNANFCPFCGTKVHRPVEEESGQQHDYDQREKDEHAGIRKFLRR